MIATLAFEKHGVLLRDAAKMSIHRYAVTSPWSLAPPLFRGAKVSKNFGIIILVALLTLTMVLSQALTAILLIDLNHDYVLGPKITTPHRRHLGPLFFSVQPLRVRPVSLARFGERRVGESFFISDDSTGKRLNDTGTTLSAFPELSRKIERENIVYYRGDGAVAEGHVVCVSPDINELIYVEPDRITGQLSSEFLYNSTREMESEGSFRWNGVQQSSDLVIDFNCTLGGYHGFMLCPLKAPIAKECPGFPTPCLLSSNTTWFLIIDEDASLLWKQDEYDDHRRPPSLELARKLYNKTAFQPDGTGWMSNAVYWDTDVGAGPRNYSTRMTLCVVATGNSLATIEIMSDWRADEPVLGNPHESNGSYTKSLRRQLSDSQDLAYRGVMNLSDFTIDEDRPFTPVIQNIRGGANDYLLYIDRATSSATRDYTNSIMLVEELDEVYWMLFRETWQDASVSWALHSLFGTLVSQAFYDQLDIPQDVFKGNVSNTTISQDATRTVQSSKEAQVPAQNVGLFIACGIVGIHMVLVAIVFWLYFTCKAEKFLDQSWQTVGQLHRGEANIFLDETANKGDLDVRRLPAVEPHWKRLVVIRDSGIAFKTTNASPGTYVSMSNIIYVPEWTNRWRSGSGGHQGRETNPAHRPDERDRNT